MCKSIITFCCVVACIFAVASAIKVEEHNREIIRCNTKLLVEHNLARVTIENQAFTLRSQSRQFNILNSEKQGILNRARDMRVELLELRKANKSSMKQVNYLMGQIDGYTQKIEALEKELEGVVKTPC